jgi:hypothetical protein
MDQHQTDGHAIALGSYESRENSKHDFTEDDNRERAEPFHQ